MTGWKYINSSEIGTAHIETGVRKQDSSFCWIGATPHKDTTGAFIAIVSDGAGSAEKGGQGAALVTRTFGVRAREFLRSHTTRPTEADIAHWIQQARARIVLAARARDLKPRDFAATLVAAIVFEDEVLIAHIGDGAAVGLRHDAQDWETLSWPETGEYASTTFFVTDTPFPSLRFAHHEGRFERLAIFSDGIERIALDFQTQSPHQAFFTSLTRPLEAVEDTGCSRLLSSSLSAFLSSERVNARTDDDKTLILALRAR
jgi:hypothetical protein